MNLEQVAAASFLRELEKIAEVEVDVGVKQVAAGLRLELDEADVTSFLKQAGFGTMLAGVGRGVGALGMGALRGAGGIASGAARGVGGALSNAASSVGNAVRSGVGALKAAPGALGARMDAFGQRAQAGMTALGGRLQQAGQAQGQAIQGRLAGPAKPAAPVASSANVESGAYKPPMLSMGQQIAESNPLHGMGSSLVQNVRNLAQNIGARRPAPAPQPAQGATYGTLAPAV